MKVYEKMQTSAIKKRQDFIIVVSITRYDRYICGLLYEASIVISSISDNLEC